MSHAIMNIADPVGIDDLARRALMSRRTFDRRFKELTGVSPLQWLLHQRILSAQRLLEETDLTVDDIAHQVGLRTALTLRRNFHHVAGESPQQYRARFRLSVPRPKASSVTG